MPPHLLAEAPPYQSDRSPRAWLPDADALVGACALSIDAGEPRGLVDLVDHLAAPLIDLTVTPLTARASLLGAQSGRAFYHHELRRRLPMPPALEPEVAVWEGGTTPAWADGVLAEPKYFSFFQDAPFPAYNPNHRRKWRAHELLHGASKFFWRPEMSRFEFYVSARLNELLPVVHWYHLDEIFRPRCPEHEDQVLHRDHCLACQQAATHYWESDAPAKPHRIAAAKQHVEGAWDHFSEEWEAIGKEIATGRPVATPRARLDASSDAMGYLRAHWNRVTAWSFGRWMELFMVDGVDYFSDLTELKHNVGRALHALVAAPLEITLGDVKARRARCQLQDLGYRVLLALEWLDPDDDLTRRTEDALMPHLERAAQLCDMLLSDASKTEAALAHFALICHTFSEISPRFPDEVGDAFLGFGYRFIDPHVFAAAAAGQVFTGIDDAMPATADRLTQPFDEVTRFVASPIFDETGRLSGRFARWAAEDDQIPDATAQLARFEAFANAEPRTDEEATLFAALPERAGALREARGTLRPHATLRRDVFDAATIATVTGQPLDAVGNLHVAAVVLDGELRLVIEDEFTATVLDQVCAGEPIDQWWNFGLAQAIMTLLEQSLLTWLPAP